MDKNKLKVLRDIGYIIPKTCGTCKHMEWGGGPFGTCSIRTYEHEKHTGDPRQLSVYAFGGCNDLYEVSLNALGDLGEHWKEFLEKREFTRSNLGKLVNKKVRY